MHGILSVVEIAPPKTKVLKKKNGEDACAVCGSTDLWSNWFYWDGDDWTGLSRPEDRDGEGGAAWLTLCQSCGEMHHAPRK
jgi:hypothetical protein